MKNSEELSMAMGGAWRDLIKDTIGVWNINV
jgi:hypothetical protein